MAAKTPMDLKVKIKMLGGNPGIIPTTWKSSQMNLISVVAAKISKSQRTHGWAVPRWLWEKPVGDCETMDTMDRERSFLAMWRSPSRADPSGQNQCLRQETEWWNGKEGCWWYSAEFLVIPQAWLHRTEVTKFILHQKYVQEGKWAQHTLAAAPSDSTQSWQIYPRLTWYLAMSYSFNPSTQRHKHHTENTAQPHNSPCL